MDNRNNNNSNNNNNNNNRVMNNKLLTSSSNNNNSLNYNPNISSSINQTKSVILIDDTRKASSSLINRNTNENEKQKYLLQMQLKQANIVISPENDDNNNNLRRLNYPTGNNNQSMPEFKNSTMIVNNNNNGNYYYKSNTNNNKPIKKFEKKISNQKMNKIIINNEGDYDEDDDEQSQKLNLKEANFRNKRTALMKDSSIESTSFTNMRKRFNVSEQEYSEIANNDDDNREDDENDQDEQSSKDKILFPGYVPIVFKYFDQNSKPRYWCLRMITSPWFERISMLVILINCITLGMYQPCNDNPCLSARCKFLQYLDHFIYVFFAVEMSIKILAMGFLGKDTYMADTWNRLDLFIVIAGTVEYAIATENLSLSAIRTVRVLRPLRAINRVPSMRILVMLLLDTLPMLGNVLLLCFFVFFIFGIVGVQLWKGVLRNRCFVDYNQTISEDIAKKLGIYYNTEPSFICSEGSGGMTTCADVPPYIENNRVCNGSISLLNSTNYYSNTSSCVNLHLYYSKCRPSDKNPFKGAISFDNIGYAWVAIFQIISLESWVTIMYYIQDAHSFWNWIYFVFLIVIGSFFMINLCLVVIATQFSETKKRETERMIAERRRFSRSSSTLLSDNAGEPGSCWEELIKYTIHLLRKSKRKIIKKYYQYKNNREKNDSEKTLKLRKKLINKEDSIKITNTNNNNNNNNNEDNVEKNICSAKFNRISCKCNCHNTNNDNITNTFDDSQYNSSFKRIKYNPFNENQLSEIMELQQQQQQQSINSNTCPRNDQTISLNKTLNFELSKSNRNSPVSKENMGFYTSGEGIDHIDANKSSLYLNASKNDSKKDMIPNNVDLNLKANCELKINKNEDNCNLCRRAHQKVLNLNDSAILSFSITSSNSHQILNKKMIKHNSNLSNNINDYNNENDLNDNEDYYYCYSANPAIEKNYENGSNFEENDHLKENKNFDIHFNSDYKARNRIKIINRKKSNNSCCLCCCQKKLSDTRLCILYSLFNEKLKVFVDSKFFQRTILFAILINTLSMGIEHHEQPPLLTQIVEYSNFFFTAVFLFEMILKLLAFGTFDYIKSAFNLFDGAIVCLSVYEVIKQIFPSPNAHVAASGVSVLRTFRLLRILKLVRFMPALRRQLIVMLKTIDNVATFFSLLILFIFIFSILGMNLFGCKFCKIENNLRICERKNFDSLLWAIITVFQVLTQEDWNEVLYNGMEKTSSWAALYFIALMTFGNYVLFNLLVAILVEGFSTEDEPKKAIEDRIREDAMHAIAEEAQSKEQSQTHVSSTRGSFRKSRRKSRVSGSGDEASRSPHMNQEKNYRNSGHNTPKQSVHNLSVENLNTREPIKRSSFKQRSKTSTPVRTNSRLDETTNENLSSKQKKFMQLPIITHTCPTPINTPSTSSRNSPLFANYKFLFDSKYLYKDKVIFKYQRKFSLDSANDRIKTPTFNKLLTRSTNSKIYDTNQGNYPANRISNNFDIVLIKPNQSPKQSSSIVKNNETNRKKLILPKILINDTSKLLDSSLLHGNRYINKVNNLKTQYVVSSKSSSTSLEIANILNRYDNENNQDNDSNLLINKDLCTSSNSSSNSEVSEASFPATLPDKLERKMCNRDLVSQKGISKSYNDNSIRTSNTASLALPSPVYKRPRSKSEKVKSKSIKIFDKEEKKKPEIIITDDETKLISEGLLKTDNHEDALIINLNNHDKPVIIKKSEPYNVDITCSEKLVNEVKKKTETKSKIEPVKENVNDLRPDSRTDSEILDFNICSKLPKPTGCFKTREDYSLYLLSIDNPLRLLCKNITENKVFDYTILLFIALNCITLAMERPNIPPHSLERKFLTNSNYAFTLIFAIEMLLKVLSQGLYVGKTSYFKSGWNQMDGFLVVISLIDVFVTLTARSSPKIFGILRVFRLLRTLRPLRVISRAPGLKLVVQTLMSSLRPIGNIVLICCTFFIIFGILGVQLFKGKLYKCSGEDVSNVKTRDDCLANPNNQWINSQYNFDNLGQALMALFVLSSKDGWVQIMYTGIDAVGVDKQPIENYNEWMLLYFISFLLLVGFFVLNMFVGVVIENFHKCREEQEREEKARRAAKRAKKFEEKRRRMKEIPYYASYGRTRRLLHDLCNSKYFDLVIAGVIGLNVVSMSLEFYMMPPILDEILDVFNIVFTFIFLIEAIMRLVALGFVRYFREKWNQLDIFIVVLSIIGIIFDKLNAKSAIPINPTIIRVMRVLRIARVLKLLKMAKGIRSLLDTVIQALPQVGNLGLLFFLLFFIFAILGVELFGKLNCESLRSACDGLSKHAHFHNFGMAFLTLFRIATGDNWNGIMKDTLKDNILCQDETTGTSSSMCLASILAPIYFVIFVLMAQFVLVNVVVAVLMKHLDDSNKMMADDAEMDEEIEKQLEAEARNNLNERALKMEDEFERHSFRPMAKQNSLPPNFTFDLSSSPNLTSPSNETLKHSSLAEKHHKQQATYQNYSKLNSTNESSKHKKPLWKRNEENRQKMKSNKVLSMGDLDFSILSSDKYKPVCLDNRDEIKDEIGKTDYDENDFSSINLSINNESDSISEIVRQRKQTPKYLCNSHDIQNNLIPKSHFSPQSSVRIKVIDETDTDNCDN